MVPNLEIIASLSRENIRSWPTRQGITIENNSLVDVLYSPEQCELFVVILCEVSQRY